MTLLWSQYWPLIVVALLIGIVAGYVAFRPRQSVRLSDDAPVRPHMVAGPKHDLPPALARRHEGRGLLDEAAAAASDVSGEILQAPVHAGLPGASDDLELLKGVGPKLAAILAERGITKFAQIARLTPDQVAGLDQTLGAFRGRFTRDRIVDQADYLARGDTDGFEREFGKL